MRESALDTLVCPMDHARLELEERETEGGHVLEGFLACEAGHRYPIIGGVPRLLPPHLLAHLPADYPEFFDKHGDEGRTDRDGGKTEAVQRQTQDAFGFEWTWADDYEAQNFADWLPDGFEMGSLFGGKTGLEVGCGAGRHAHGTSSLARQHFAVDLSRAVDSAFERNRERENCHVVQADAFHLPFRPGTLEYVYCLGVLQHFHDPPAGFDALARFPKTGGTLLVNVYQASRPLTVGALELFRKLTTRMSNRSVGRLSQAFGNVEYGLLIFPWKKIRGTGLGSVVRPLVPGRVNEYAKHDRHTCVVDWFDRLACPVKKHYKREQLIGWYEQAGYDQIVVTPYWKAFWNGYGRRLDGGGS